MQFRSNNSKNYQKYSIYISKYPVSMYSRYLRLHNICPKTTSKDMIKKCVPSYASRQFNSIQIIAELLSIEATVKNLKDRRMETGQTDSRQTYTGPNFLCILFGFYTRDRSLCP